MKTEPTQIALPSIEFRMAVQQEHAFTLLVALARHISAMSNDAYFEGHPEWAHITAEARTALRESAMEWARGNQP